MYVYREREEKLGQEVNNVIVRDNPLLAGGTIRTKEMKMLIAYEVV
jgi:hypothetical protein